MVRITTYGYGLCCRERLSAGPPGVGRCGADRMDMYPVRGALLAAEQGEQSHPHSMASLAHAAVRHSLKRMHVTGDAGSSVWAGHLGKLHLHCIEEQDSILDCNPAQLPVAVTCSLTTSWTVPAGWAGT